MALLGDVGGDDGVKRGHIVVAHPRQATAHRENLRHMPSERSGRDGAHLLQDPPGTAPAIIESGAVQNQIAHADRLDAAGGEIVDPGAESGVEGDLIALGGGAAVAQPHGGVLHRVLPFTLDHPGVEVVWQPGPHVLTPVLAAVVLPVAEHDGDTARTQVLADGGHEGGEHRGAGVAVLHEGQAGLAHGGRSEDERRVGGDQVEGAAAQRFEEGAADQLEAVGLGTRQSGVEGGEGQGTRGDVGGGDALGMAQEVEGLDAAAAAQIHGGGHGRARSEGGQGQARPTDAQDVVGGEFASGGELAEVGGDPPAHLAGVVGRLVGAQVHCRTDDAHGGRGLGVEGRGGWRGRWRCRYADTSTCGLASSGRGGRRTGRRPWHGARPREPALGVAGLIAPIMPDGEDEAHRKRACCAGAGKSRIELTGRNGLTEHEQGGEHGDRRRGGAGVPTLGQGRANGPQSRQADLAMQGGRSRIAQKVGHGLDAPTTGDKILAQSTHLLSSGGGRRRRGRGTRRGRCRGRRGRAHETTVAVRRASPAHPRTPPRTRSTFSNEIDGVTVCFVRECLSRRMRMNTNATDVSPPSEQRVRRTERA